MKDLVMLLLLTFLVPETLAQRGAMKRTTMVLLLGSLLGCLFPTASLAQDEADAAIAFGAYEPSPAYPFGRPHPEAPPELEHFAFMIGAFDCVDEIRQQDGSWNRFPAVWNAYYFLNGHGIQDKYWAPTFSTSNLRIFDPKKGKWMVTFFKMPGYQSSVWEGVQEGETMVMRQGGRTTGSGLTFYNITEDGFDWRSGDNPNWKSSCRRRQ